MKRSLWLAVVLVLAVALAACGNSTEDLSMATGSAAGAYYAYGDAMASAINNADAGLNITVGSSSGSAENIQLIAGGGAQLAILRNDVLDYSFYGSYTWEGEAPVTNTAVLAGLYPEVCQIIALESAGIASIPDLAGKRVSTGPIGSGAETNAKQILEAYGLTFGDIKQQHLNFSDSAEAMVNGSLDAVFITAGAPSASVLELAASQDIVMVPVDGAAAESLLSQYPFYIVAEITPEQYRFMTAPTVTVATQATLICSTEMKEDVAYAVVKALFDNKDTIAASHDNGHYLDPAYAVQGASIDFHPGALKFYREAGAL